MTKTQACLWREWLPGTTEWACSVSIDTTQPSPSHLVRCKTEKDDSRKEKRTQTISITEELQTISARAGTPAELQPPEVPHHPSIPRHHIKPTQRL